jgi:hypothetical protein
MHRAGCAAAFAEFETRKMNFFPSELAPQWRCPRPYTPHPSPRRQAAQRCGNERHYGPQAGRDRALGRHLRLHLASSQRAHPLGRQQVAQRPAERECLGKRGSANLRGLSWTFIRHCSPFPALAGIRIFHNRNRVRRCVSVSRGDLPPRKGRNMCRGAPAPRTQPTSETRELIDTPAIRKRSNSLKTKSGVPF